MKSFTMIWVEEYEMDHIQGWRIGVDGICRTEPMPTVLDAIKYTLDHVPPDFVAGARPDEETMNALAELIKAYGGFAL